MPKLAYALCLICLTMVNPVTASAQDWKSGLGLGFEKMHGVCQKLRR